VMVISSISRTESAAVETWAPQGTSSQCCSLTPSIGSVLEVEPNNNLHEAQNLECEEWELETKSDIENSNVITYTWVSVNGTGDNTYDWYYFQTPNITSNPYFTITFYVEIDYAWKSGGGETSFDSYIIIYPADGSPSSYNNNDYKVGGDGYNELSTGSETYNPPDTRRGRDIVNIRFDSYYGLSSGPQNKGYYVQVAKNTNANYGNDPSNIAVVPEGATYQLQVSMQLHTYHSDTNSNATFPSPALVCGDEGSQSSSAACTRSFYTQFDLI